MSLTLALAWALSLVPAILAWLPGRGWMPPGPSVLALTALPWVAFAGMPRAVGEGRAEPRRGRAFLALALALAPLAIGAGIDLRAGVPAAPLFALGAGAAALVLLLELSADRAAGSERAERARGWTWLAVVAMPLLAASLHIGAPARALPRVVELAAGATPLGWCAENAAAERLRAAQASPWSLAPWLPAALTLGLCALARRRSRSRA